MKLEKLKASPLAIAGAWFDAEARDYKPLRHPHATHGCVLVGAYDTPRYREAKHKALSAAAQGGAKDWQSAALADGCVLDWRNFDEAPYSKEKAVEVLVDPEFFQFRKFVDDCASVMSHTGREALEEAAGN